MTEAGAGVADGAAGAAAGAVGGAAGWSQGRVDDEFFAIVAGLAAEPTELIDAATGEVAGRARRSVWGVPVWEGVSSPLGFAGQVYDGESGLLYNRFRFYDPVAASYTAPDPLGVGANPDSASGYVHNPVTWVDPLGLKGCSKKLGNNLEEAGKPKFDGAEAHHIVPEGHSGAKDARDLLKKHDIDIDSAENGVWLQAKNDTPRPNAFPNSLSHRGWINQRGDGIHSKAYIKAVTRRIDATTTRQEAVDELAEMADMMQYGRKFW